MKEIIIEYLPIAIHAFIIIIHIITTLFSSKKMTKLCQKCLLPHEEETPCPTLSEWYLSYMKSQGFTDITISDTDSVLDLYKTTLPIMYQYVLDKYKEETHHDN